jgi:hypothetical protein
MKTGRPKMDTDICSRLDSFRLMLAARSSLGYLQTGVERAVYIGFAIFNHAGYEQLSEFHDDRRSNRHGGDSLQPDTRF